MAGCEIVEVGGGGDGDLGRTELGLVEEDGGFGCAWGGKGDCCGLRSGAVGGGGSEGEVADATTEGEEVCQFLLGCIGRDIENVDGLMRHCELVFCCLQ